MTDQETWQPVVGYEDAYEVSDHGNVRSLDRWAVVGGRWGEPIRRKYRGRVLKTTDNGVGYLVVHLCDETGRKTALVHRLVASAFTKAEQGKAFVNHRNGDKHDNRAVNLEWCSRSENMQHAHDTGLLDSRVVPVIGTCLRTGRQTYYEKQIDAEIALSGTGRPSSAVHHCLAGKKKTAYGMTWRLA